MKKTATTLDRVIAYFAPGAGLARVRNRMAFRNFYEAGEPPGRLRRDTRAKGDANVSTQRGAVTLREKARTLDENFDIAIGVLDVLVNNTVGTGVRPEPQVMNRDGTPCKPVNDALTELFRDWIKIPEVTWRDGYYTHQRKLARTLFRDGEVFDQLIAGNVPTLDHGTRVPFSLEGLEPDFVPYDLNDADRGIVQGIGLNAWGRPRAYYCFKTHPGADSSGTYAIAGSDNIKVIPAENMIHAAITTRLHQLRGVSIFRGTFSRFEDVKDIDESERIAARVAAAIAVAITKGNPDTYNNDGPNATEPRNFDISPGMIFDGLLPGEDVKIINSNRPNSQLEAFRQSQMRSAAAGVGASASSISKNYDGSYSSQRQELIESKGSYDVMTDYFIDVIAQPIWEHFVDAAIAARLVVIPNTANRATIYDASHSKPALPWIDPLKEATALGMMEDRAYTSRTEIVRSRGRQPEEVLREIRRDQDLAAELDVETARLRATAAAGGSNNDTPNNEGNNNGAVDETA